MLYTLHPQAWTILYLALPLLLDEFVPVNHLWSTQQPARDQLVSYPLPIPPSPPPPPPPTHTHTHIHLYPHTSHFPNHSSSFSQYQCDLSGGDRCIYTIVSGLVYNCSLHLWGLPPVLLPVDAGRVLPHKLEKLCVATNLLLSHSSVCVCMCVCMSVTMYGCQFACFFQVVMPPFSWHEPPEETYSDVNIFGLQTVYLVVSICTSWRIPLQAINICMTIHTTHIQLAVCSGIHCFYGLLGLLLLLLSPACRCQQWHPSEGAALHHKER